MTYNRIDLPYIYIKITSCHWWYKIDS